MRQAWLAAGLSVTLAAGGLGAALAIYAKLRQKPFRNYIELIIVAAILLGLYEYLNYLGR